MAINSPIVAPVYNGRDNVVRLVLFDRGEPLDLTPVSRVTVEINGTLIDSDVAGAGVIWWTDEQQYRGALVDVLSLQLGDQGLAAGSYDDCEIVVYDDTYTNGLQIENRVKITVHD